MSGNVCWVDTETTGLLADRHEIWEVGLIMPDGSEYQWLLALEHLPTADPIALSIGRFHQRHPNGNESFSSPDSGHPTSKGDFASQFRVRTHGLHLAGAVVSFDAERLTKLLHSQGVVPSWHYHLIDVEAMAAGWLMSDAVRVEKEVAERQADPNLSDWAKIEGIVGADVRRLAATPPWDSNELSRAVGVDPDQFDRHTAIGDARWAKAIYEKVMGQ